MKAFFLLVIFASEALLRSGFNIGLVNNGYQRHPYQWNYTYGQGSVFQPPLNSDPRTHHLWHQASQIFRHYDKNWDGGLSHHEFRKALNHTGYNVSHDECDRLFWLIDTNRSDRLSEQEFAEFWVYVHGGSPYHLQGYGGGGGGGHHHHNQW